MHVRVKAKPTYKDSLNEFRETLPNQSPSPPIRCSNPASESSQYTLRGTSMRLRRTHGWPLMLTGVDGHPRWSVFWQWVKGWEDIETYALSKLKGWLGAVLTLPNGIPCPWCLTPLYLNASARPDLGDCFQRWCVRSATGGSRWFRLICRRWSSTMTEHESALHIVGAWVSEHRLALGQMKVSTKSNQIHGIPALLGYSAAGYVLLTPEPRAAIARQFIQAKAKTCARNLRRTTQRFYAQVKNLV